MGRMHFKASYKLAAIAVLACVVPAFVFYETTQQGLDGKALGAPKGAHGASSIAEEKSIIPPQTQFQQKALRYPKDAKVDIWASVLIPMDSDARLKEILSPMDVVNNYKDTSAKARAGDPSAALGLYQHAKYCEAVGRRSGASLPPECGVYVATPQFDAQYWLSLANKTKDPRAAIMLFGEVRDAINYAGSAALASDQMRAAAMASLEESLEVGSSEVFLMLSNAYSDGLLVSQDLVKAFAYLDIYARSTGDPGAASRAAQLALNLRHNDLREIDIIQEKVLKRVKNRQQK